MEEGGGSRTARDLNTGGVHVEDAGSSSDQSLSTASSTTLKNAKITNAERKKERKERREAKTARTKAREKKKEVQQKLDEKLQRKEERRLIHEERAKRRAARAKEEEKKAYDASSSELSSSSDDGDDDVTYHASKGNKNKGKKKDRKDKGSSTKNKYVTISFNYSYVSNHDHKSFINVPAGKLPHFDGTNFAKWKHLMRAYLIGLHPSLWKIMCSGFQPPKDPEEPTNEELAAIHLNGQVMSILLSALNGNGYNRVINVDVAKQIWDTLHLAHEGVDKVRRAKIDLLMAKLNRFVIFYGEGPQEMFDRLMTLVGKIRGYGCDDFDDHKVVKVMLEAYSPRNETVVTLIRDKKKFEHFTPNDVLGRLLTFDMQ
jgi:hypothetical protein